MDSSAKDKELKISGSTVPIIRAGFANIIFIVLFSFLVLLNQLLSDLSLSTLPRAILVILIIALAIKIYLHSVSRFYIREDGSFVIVGPLFEKRIHLLNVAKTKIYGMPTSMTIVLMIKTKNSLLPSFFFFVAISNFLGPFNETKEKLASILGR